MILVYLIAAVWTLGGLAIGVAALLDLL